MSSAAEQDPYLAFLADKVPPAQVCGLACSIDDVAERFLDGRELKPHQRAIVAWAVRGGRRALFEKFGLGKTVQQLEILRLIVERTGGDALIVAPLGVRQEFRRDAALLGIDLRVVRDDAEIVRSGDEPGIFLTHYEAVRLGKIDVTKFTAVSLDEAAVLRDYGSDTYQTFLPLFASVPYRFVATATPSPNRYKELIHYAAFLGLMDSGQALTRFFQRNSEKAGELTLYPHKEVEFWEWLNSWAVFLQTPSDLGFPDDGYALPPIEVRWHKVLVDIASGAGADDRGQGLLLRDAALGVTQAAREKRDSLGARIDRVRELIEADPDEHVVVWHDLEAERRALEEAVTGIVTLSGASPLDEREARIVAFAEGRQKRIGLKPSMFGAGTNIQPFCRRAIFAGVGFKFHDFIQAVHRIYRFGQARPVIIDVVYAETEELVVRDLREKWARHDTLTDRMAAMIRARGLGSLDGPQITRAMGVTRREAAGEGWRLVNNDSVIELRTLEADSLDLVVTSIPFGTQYEYCASYHDLGHNDDNAGFWRQMDHLTPSLLRAMKPGRIACIHVKDRIRFGNVTGDGVPTLDPFSDETVAHFRRHGFQYLARRTVTTDVVRENNQTYRLGYTELCKDSTTKGAGVPEYVLFFRKPQSDRSRGYADEPVTKDPAVYSLARWQLDAHAYWPSSGDRLLTADEIAALPISLLPKAFAGWSAATVYDHETHVAIGEAVAGRGDARGSLPKTFMALAPGSAHPDVWTDIVRMRTLNNEQSLGGREKHVCPLQIDIADRCIRLYSNPGDLVFDPFAGIGTVPVRALKLGRRGAGCELHDQYFDDAVRYCAAMERELAVPSMFELMGAAEEAA